jgi:cell division protein ZipA
MDMLRWILLLLGVAVVVVIYLYTAHQRQQRDIHRQKQDDEPEIEGIAIKVENHEVSVQEIRDELSGLDAMLKDDIEETADAEPEPTVKPARTRAKKKSDKKKAPPAKQAADAEMFVILHVAAKLPDLFQGEAVLSALNECGLEYGELGIFHRHREVGGRDRILYSVASMVKPGTLNPEELVAGLEVPGLSLFMRLPSSMPGTELYQDLLDCTQRLADSLGGRILDEHRSVLTHQAMEMVLEDIRLFELKTAQ